MRKNRLSHFRYNVFSILRLSGFKKIQIITKTKIHFQLYFILNQVQQIIRMKN